VEVSAAAVFQVPLHTLHPRAALGQVARLIQAHLEDLPHTVRGLLEVLLHQRAPHLALLIGSQSRKPVKGRRLEERILSRSGLSVSVLARVVVHAGRVEAVYAHPLHGVLLFGVALALRAQVLAVAVLPLPLVVVVSHPHHLHHGVAVVGALAVLPRIMFLFLFLCQTLILGIVVQVIASQAILNLGAPRQITRAVGHRLYRTAKLTLTSAVAAVEVIEQQATPMSEELHD
jgi:hypothetical protein